MLVHVVLFKLKSDVTSEHKSALVRELKSLRTQPSVRDGKLWVGSPSVTNPIERTQGFEIALVSLHDDLEALEVYQASDEHKRIASGYIWPYKEDVVRFDFIVDGDDPAAGESLAGSLVKE